MSRTRVSPMQRTLKLLRGQGYYPWIVESFNAFSGQRRDLYRIIDAVFITHKNTVGVQVCGADFSEHRKKIMEEEGFNTRFWLRNPSNELIVIGWRKVLKKRGGKLMIYKPRIAIVTLEDKELKFKEVKFTWLRKRKK